MEKKMRRKVCPMCKDMQACARKKCASCSFDFKKGQKPSPVACTRSSEKGVQPFYSFLGMTSSRLRTRAYDSVREKSVYPLMNRKRQQSMDLDIDKRDEAQPASTPVEPTPPQSPQSPESGEKVPVLKLKLSKPVTLSDQGDEKENTYVIKQTEDGEPIPDSEIKEVVTMVTNEVVTMVTNEVVTMVTNEDNNIPLIVDGDDIPVITSTPISTQSIQISAEALKNLNQNQDSPIFGHLKPLKFHENSFETLKKRTECAERKRVSGEGETVTMSDNEQTSLLENVAAQISLSYQMQMNNVRERGRPPSIYNAVQQLNNTPTTSNINVQSPNMANVPRKRGRPKGSTTKFRHKAAQQSQYIHMWNKQNNKQLTDLEMALLNISNKQYQAKPYQNILPAQTMNSAHLVHSLNNSQSLNNHQNMGQASSNNVTQNNLMGSLVNLQLQQAINSLQTSLNPGPNYQPQHNPQQDSTTSQINALISQLQAKPAPPPPRPAPPPQPNFIDMFNRLVKAETSSKQPAQPTPNQMLQSLFTNSLMANSPQNSLNNQHINQALNNQQFLQSVINNSPSTSSNQQLPPMSIKVETPPQSFASLIKNNNAQTPPSFISSAPATPHYKDLNAVLDVLGTPNVKVEGDGGLSELEQLISSLKTAPQTGQNTVAPVQTSSAEFVPRKRGRPSAKSLPGTATFEQHSPVISQSEASSLYMNEKRTRGRPRKYPEHHYQVVNGKMRYPGAKERKLYFPIDDYSSLSQLHILPKEPSSSDNFSELLLHNKQETKESDEATPSKKRGRPKGSKNKPNLLTAPSQILDLRAPYPATSSVWAGLPDSKQGQLGDILQGINAKMSRQAFLNV